MHQSSVLAVDLEFHPLNSRTTSIYHNYTQKCSFRNNVSTITKKKKVNKISSPFSYNNITFINIFLFRTFSRCVKAAKRTVGHIYLDPDRYRKVYAGEPICKGCRHNGVSLELEDKCNTSILLAETSSSYNIHGSIYIYTYTHIYTSCCLSAVRGVIK